MNEILYKKELSEEYRIPLATLNWWRHAGQGPRSFKIGNKVCYKRADSVTSVPKRPKPLG